MDQQEQRPADAPAAQGAPATAEAVDIVALTAAVERLLRRDLEIERERLLGSRRIWPSR